MKDGRERGAGMNASQSVRRPARYAGGVAFEDARSHFGRAIAFGRLVIARLKYGKLLPTVVATLLVGVWLAGFCQIAFAQDQDLEPLGTPTPAPSLSHGATLFQNV